MSRGRYFSLEEALKDGKLDQFATEHPSIGDWNKFDRLFEAMARGEAPRKKPRADRTSDSEPSED